MSLIKNKEGNFYPIEIKDTDWHCDWLWSTHRGCPFDCAYCSSKRLNIRFGGDPTKVRRLKGEWVDIGGFYEPIRLTRLLPGAGVFVNPYCDMFALPQYDIGMILSHCQDEMTRKQNPKLNFIFQTKDPAKYFDYLDWIPNGSWLGTTIETDDMEMYSDISKAPNLLSRVIYMSIFTEKPIEVVKIFVTIEPIMKFSPSLLFWMSDLKPDLIFIGANTSKIQLPEPFADDIMQLVMELSKFTKVYLKSNIKRLIPTYFYNQWKDGLFEKEIK